MAAEVDWVVLPEVTIFAKGIGECPDIFKRLFIGPNHSKLLIIFRANGQIFTVMGPAEATNLEVLVHLFTKLACAQLIKFNTCEVIEHF